jgi:hypothetical protein
MKKNSIVIILLSLLLVFFSQDISWGGRGGGGFSGGMSGGGRSFGGGSSWGGRSSSPSSSSWGSKGATTPSPSKGTSWGSKESTTTAQKQSATKWGSKSDTGTSKSQSARSNIVNSESKAKVQADYVKRTTPQDWNKSRSTYMAGRTTYTPTYATVTRTPQQRTIVINRYHNSYGGYYYGDPYNHSLIFTFSTLWWFNHWDSIDRERYANDARYRQLEAEIAALRAKGTTPDPNYKDPGMDEGVMYGDGYLNKAKEESSSHWLRNLLIFFVIVALVTLAIIRRRIVRRSS